MPNTCGMYIENFSSLPFAENTIKVNIVIGYRLPDAEIQYILYDTQNNPITDFLPLADVNYTSPTTATGFIINNSVSQTCAIGLRLYRGCDNVSGSSSGSGSGGDPCDSQPCVRYWDPNACVSASIIPCYIDDGKLPFDPATNCPAGQPVEVSISKTVIYKGQSFIYLEESDPKTWIAGNGDSISIQNSLVYIYEDEASNPIKLPVRYRDFYGDYTVDVDPTGCCIDCESPESYLSGVILPGGTSDSGVYEYCTIGQGGTYSGWTANSSMVLNNANITLSSEPDPEWETFSILGTCPSGDPPCFQGNLQMDLQYAFITAFTQSTCWRGYCDPTPGDYAEQDEYSWVTYLAVVINGELTFLDPSSYGTYTGNELFGAPVNSFAGSATVGSSDCTMPSAPAMPSSSDILFGRACELCGTCNPSIDFVQTCRVAPPTSCDPCPAYDGAVDYNTFPKYSYELPCPGKPIDIDIDACTRELHPVTFSQDKFVLYYVASVYPDVFPVIDNIAYDTRAGNIVKIFETATPTEMRNMVCSRLRFATLVDETKLESNIHEALISNWPFNDLYWFSQCSETEVPINLVPC